MDILERILARKRVEVEERSRDRSLERVRDDAMAAAPPRGFLKALQRRIADGDPAVIAEIKRASPSKGVIREDFQPAQIARQYAAGGAACLSVLTDQDFFQGHDDFLREARAACDLPVLRKDFVLDPWQVYESRALGADAILLIVAALNDEQLLGLAAIAHGLGMDVLVEVHDRAELVRALAANSPLIGVNNRNLRSFETDLGITLALKPDLPDAHVLVTESGIHERADVLRMRTAGVHAFLVGEAFMRAADPGARLADLFFSELDVPQAR